MTKIKKFKAKTHKGTVKRIKITNGSDPNTGILMINRINDNHRNIGKSRTRLLKAKRKTKLHKGYKKLRSIIKV
jgi:ribosomal protein L35